MATPHRAGQKRLFGGCRLTRPITDLITEAGFNVTDLDAFYQPGAPKCGGAVYLGAAKPATTPPTESHGGPDLPGEANVNGPIQAPAPT